RDEWTRREENTKTVAALLSECEGHIRADDADRALAAYRPARERLKDGGEELFAHRAARCRADLQALTELDRADALYWTVAAGRSTRLGSRSCWRNSRARRPRAPNRSSWPRWPVHRATSMCSWPSAPRRPARPSASSGSARHSPRAPRAPRPAPRSGPRSS